MPTTDFKDAVLQAEAAVSGVKDPDLRKIAFEKVLGVLLGETRPQTAISTKKERPRRVRSVAARGGPTAYVEDLIAAGFFKAPKQFKAIMEALEAAGRHMSKGTLSPTLIKLCRDHKLRRRKVNGSWEYSNW